jgi:ATP/maltotriose-dependent transcriptional regulator MalT
LATPADSHRRRDLFGAARKLNAWDPVLFGLRISQAFATQAAADNECRGDLERLYRRVGEVVLARRAQLRARADVSGTAVPLSARELEVLNLIALGYRNRDISRALFIADSTTKVHIRHIFEKLGVRSRAEAVARLQRLRGES